MSPHPMSCQSYIDMVESEVSVLAQPWRRQYHCNCTTRLENKSSDLCRKMKEERKKAKDSANTERCLQ
jgi:hypothetical protein